MIDPPSQYLNTSWNHPLQNRTATRKNLMIAGKTTTAWCKTMKWIHARSFQDGRDVVLKDQGQGDERGRDSSGRKMVAETDRQAGRQTDRLFAQPSIRTPRGRLSHFANLCTSSSHPHLRPSSLSPGESLAGNRQRRSGTPDPRLPGNHTLTWWSGRRLQRPSVRAASVFSLDPQSPDNPRDAHARTTVSWNNASGGRSRFDASWTW